MSDAHDHSDEELIDPENFDGFDHQAGVSFVRRRGNKLAVTQADMTLLQSVTESMKNTLTDDERNPASMVIHTSSTQSFTVNGPDAPSIYVPEQDINGIYTNPVHSSDLERNGYDDPMQPLNWMFANKATHTNWSNGDLEVYRDTEEGEDGEEEVVFRVRTQRDLRKGEAVLVVAGELYSGYYHSLYLKKQKGRKDTCSYPIPLECFHLFFNETLTMAKFRGKELVVECGTRGNIASFLRCGDTPNLKPQVVVDLKTDMPTVFYSVCRDVPAGTELTIANNRHDFVPFPHQNAPAAPAAQAPPAAGPAPRMRPFLARAAKKARTDATA